MKRKGSFRFLLKLTYCFVDCAAIAAIIFFIPPNSFLEIGTVIVLVSLFCFLFLSFFFTRKNSLFVSFGMLLFLFITLLTGFSIVNTILLVSAVIGLIVLIQ